MFVFICMFNVVKVFKDWFKLNNWFNFFIVVVVFVELFVSLVEIGIFLLIEIVIFLLILNFLNIKLVVLYVRFLLLLGI